MIEMTVVVGPMQCNCRILVCEKTAKAAIIDPGDEASKLAEAIAGVSERLKKDVQVEALFHTHAHLDHFGGTKPLKGLLGDVPEIYLHKDDEELWENLPTQCAMFGLDYGEAPPVNRWFEDGQSLGVGNLKFEVIHTPGHSPGGVCLRLSESKDDGVSETLFSGDTLFQGSIGRTDLWGGETDTLLKSIKERLFVLDDDTCLCPGHGPDSLIGVEKRENPFF